MLPPELEKFLKPRWIKQDILCVDKPLGLSSFAVVELVRRYVSRKVGHAGTLDPLAQGALILLLGSATSLVELYQRQDKVYDVGILLGARTKSFDLEQPLEDFSQCEGLESEKIKEAFDSMLGEHEYAVMGFSALKIQGKRLYKSDGTYKVKKMTLNEYELKGLNRIKVTEVSKLLEQKAKEIKANFDLFTHFVDGLNSKLRHLKQNLVNVFERNLEILSKHQDMSFYLARVTMSVGKGTYVRSLVERMSYFVGCPAVAVDIYRQCLYN